jgi:hypothetical protein
VNRIRVLALLVTASFACAAGEIRLTFAERQGETEWLSSLGLQVPEAGLLLETPFAAPFTSRSLLTPTAWWRTPAADRVSADSLRLDLTTLRAVMQKAYGGWDSAQKRGWDWNRWFAAWDRDLAAKGTAQLAIAEALGPFGKLEAFQLDNHSGPVGLFFQSGSRSAVLDGVASGECTQMRTVEGAVFAVDPKDPAQAPRKALVLGDTNVPEREGYYFAYPARRGVLAAVQCGGKWLDARPTWAHSKQQLMAGLAGRSANEPSYRALSAGIAYLRLPSFNKQNGELLGKLIATLPVSAGGEKLLIVDLRGNDGGDAPLDMLARWIDVASAAKVARGFGRRLPQSCLYTALRWGYQQFTTRALQPPISDGLRATLQKQLDGLFAPAEAGCPVTVQENGPVWGYREHRLTAQPPPGKPRLLLLVDNECGSDCELLTYVLAAQSGTVVAGENTFGVGQFIQPGYFILPRTRVPFRLALGMSDIYGDSRSFDGYGLDVDILLPTEESQGAPAILRLARRLAEQPR